MTTLLDSIQLLCHQINRLMDDGTDGTDGTSLNSPRFILDSLEVCLRVRCSWGEWRRGGEEGGHQGRGGRDKESGSMAICWLNALRSMADAYHNGASLFS